MKSGFSEMVSILVLQILLAGTGTVATFPAVYDQRQTGKTNVRVDVKDAVIIAVGEGELGGDYDYSYDYSDLTIKPPPAPSTAKPSSPEPSTTLADTPASPSSTAASQPQTNETPVHMPTSQSASPKPTTSVFNTSNLPSVILNEQNHSLVFPSAKPTANGSPDPDKLLLSPTRPDQIPVVILQELLGNPNKFLPVKIAEDFASGGQASGGEKAFRRKPSLHPELLPRRNCSPGFFLDSHNRCKRIVKQAKEKPQTPTGLRHENKPPVRS